MRHKATTLVIALAICWTPPAAAEIPASGPLVEGQIRSVDGAGLSDVTVEVVPRLTLYESDLRRFRGQPLPGAVITTVTGTGYFETASRASENMIESKIQGRIDWIHDDETKDFLKDVASHRRSFDGRIDSMLKESREPIAPNFERLEANQEFVQWAIPMIGGGTIALSVLLAGAGLVAQRTTSMRSRSGGFSAS